MLPASPATLIHSTHFADMTPFCAGPVGCGRWQRPHSGCQAGACDSRALPTSGRPQSNNAMWLSNMQSVCRTRHWFSRWSVTPLLFGASARSLQLSQVGHEQAGTENVKACMHAPRKKLPICKCRCCFQGGHVLWQARGRGAVLRHTTAAPRPFDRVSLFNASDCITASAIASVIDLHEFGHRLHV